MPQTSELDVVVVGAGLAGLNAARWLKAFGNGVAVLEARAEVGGRTRTRTMDGGVVADFGGEWIGYAHHRMRDLARELGVATEPAGQLGHPYLWRLPSGDSVGRLPPSRTWPSLVRLYVAAIWIGRGIDTDAPWNAKRARTLDEMSVAEWLDRLSLNQDSRYIVERLVGALTGPNLTRLSLLHLLWLLRLAGGPVRTLATTFQWRLSDGAQELGVRMADALGDVVRLDTAVQSIQQDETGVTLRAGDKLILRAKHAIIAVPPPQVARIEFEPPMSEAHREVSHLEVAAGVKVIAVLPRGHDVRHMTVVGGKRVWGAWRRGERITGFVPSSHDAADDVLAADLAHAFSVDVDQLRAKSVFRWSQADHIEGCDAAFAPGQVCRFGPRLAEPHGRVHFAGAERSSWPDNMEGALQSGERAAREIMASDR